MSTTYMFNLMFASILIVTLVALGKYSMAGELGLVLKFLAYYNSNFHQIWGV